MSELIDDMSADDVVRLLDLAPHPEGGFYKETFRDPDGRDGRAFSTAIYYLLRDREASHWHRVDSAEVWHWYGGGTISLSLAAGEAGEAPQAFVLGGNLAVGERPQLVVPAGVWQSAVGCGAWTLVGCTVAPGFEFAAFELAPDGWTP